MQEEGAIDNKQDMGDICNVKVETNSSKVSSASRIA
jgi:hypothetical protein